LLGTDTDQVLNEVKAAVDRITSFPEDIERPTVFMPRFRNQVLSVALYGDQEPAVLKALAEKVRDGLLQNRDVTVVEVNGLPPLEISVEVSQENLRRYGLTIEQIALLVRQASIEMPGGAVKTSGGEILLRTTERRQEGQDFADIVVRSMPDGSRLRLGDIATIKDGFAETDQQALYLGKPAIMINVYRVGEQTPLEVSRAVKDFVKDYEDQLPPGVDMAIWFDMSEFYKDRMDLLLRNAVIGLILVLVVLGIFLEIRLAFWVTMGIPISFVGSFLFLPSTDVSINMISLFAFIVVLGMVVDDAIVVGEVVYRKLEDGMGRLEAAIAGVKEVAAPVVFAIITTVMAFTPMLFVPGIMGKFFRVIPIVVIMVLLISLVESLLILPAHLAHAKQSSSRGVFGFIGRQQQRFSRALARHIHRFYVPVIAFVARRRYLTMSAGLAVFLITMGLVAGGRVAWIDFPAVESDVIVAQVEMPYGTSIERTSAAQQRLLDAANQILDEHGRHIARGLYSNVGAAGLTRNDPGMPATGGTHLAEVAIYLVSSDQRDIRTEEFVREWRRRVGEIAGIHRLKFIYDTGPASGPPVNIELNHPELDRLEAAASALASRLGDFAGVYDVDDGFEDGKEQLDLKLRPEARALGLTELDLARQIRSAFFGAEAVRQQRGRDELKVYVRLPRSERESEYNLEELIVRTPQGGEIPLHQAAEISRGYSYTTIRRINGRRAVFVTAEVDPALNNASDIMATLTTGLLPRLLEEYPGVRFDLGGDAMEMREANQSLFIGFILALLAMFALLAVAFRSYIQPVIVMLAIPFGIVGAILGHMLMGYDLSMMSTMGIVALAGVVVNDSLLMVVTINRVRDDGKPLLEAVIIGGALRFRPIILTSLTTFFGLFPMILETSVQARFLIPMAISLGFGVIFATFITLLLVPAAYMILADIARAVSRIWQWFKRTWNGAPPPAPRRSASDLVDEHKDS
jgi:multidrug efflux pump subunit AcrB